MAKKIKSSDQITQTKLSSGNTVPESKDLDWCFTEKNGLVILNLNLMMFPLSMDSIILEHICLQFVHGKRSHSSEKHITTDLDHNSINNYTFFTVKGTNFYRSPNS